MCPSEATYLPAELLFQWTSTIKIQLRVLVYYKEDINIIPLTCNLFRLDIAEQIIIWL
jgi:hypothetical protein